jgi:hypothetical protein
VAESSANSQGEMLAAKLTGTPQDAFWEKIGKIFAAPLGRESQSQWGPVRLCQSFGAVVTSVNAGEMVYSAGKPSSGEKIKWRHINIVIRFIFYEYYQDRTFSFHIPSNSLFT